MARIGMRPRASVGISEYLGFCLIMDQSKVLNQCGIQVRESPATGGPFHGHGEHSGGERTHRRRGRCAVSITVFQLYYPGIVKDHSIVF